MALTANGVAGRPARRLMISGEEGQIWLQRLRMQCDDSIGIGTVIADDPLLTCRLPGLKNRSPRRFVFDRQLRMPPDSKLVQTAKDVPVFIFVEQ